MNKFQQTLNGSNEAIKGKRSELLSKKVKGAADKVIQNLEEEINQLEIDYDSKTDIYPDSELSLLVVKSDFNAEKWFQEINDIQVNIANKKFELDVAKNTHATWFDDQPKEKDNE